jgi:hypothetical protein
LEQICGFQHFSADDQVGIQAIKTARHAFILVMINLRWSQKSKTFANYYLKTTKPQETLAQ